MFAFEIIYKSCDIPNIPCHIPNKSCDIPNLPCHIPNIPNIPCDKLCDILNLPCHIPNIPRHISCDIPNLPVQMLSYELYRCDKCMSNGYDQYCQAYINVPRTYAVSRTHVMVWYTEGVMSRYTLKTSVVHSE